MHSCASYRLRVVAAHLQVYSATLSYKWIVHADVSILKHLPTSEKLPGWTVRVRLIKNRETFATIHMTSQTEI